MKNKFNIPVMKRDFNSNFLHINNNSIDKYTTSRGDLDYTRDIKTNFRRLYFGFRLIIRKK